MQKSHDVHTACSIRSSYPFFVAICMHKPNLDVQRAAIHFLGERSLAGKDIWPANVHVDHSGSSTPSCPITSKPWRSFKRKYKQVFFEASLFRPSPVLHVRDRGWPKGITCAALTGLPATGACWCQMYVMLEKTGT